MNDDCSPCRGWPTEIRAIYARYVALAGWPAMDFGPAHIVWSDGNFDRDSVQWCVDHFDEYSSGLSTAEREAVMASLVELLALPDSVFDAVPDDFGPDDDPAVPQTSG